MKPTSNEWTAQRVKEELPDIPVMHLGKRMVGKVRGRKLPFPVVYLADPAHHGFQMEMTWEGIAGLLNKGLAATG